MARGCLLTRAGAAVAAQWSLEDDALLATPAGGLAEAYRLDEISGIGGDEYGIELSLGGGTVTLSRLGADGSTLLAALRRAWPPARARALRLEGTGEPKRFTATVAAGDAAPRHASLVLYEDALLVAPDGADVEPVFLGLVATIAPEEATLSLRLAHWDGSSTVVSKLAGQAQEFADALLSRRARLAAEATAVLAGALPTLAASARTTLAARWLPGRALGRAELETICPGFGAAFAASWLAQLPRAAYAQVLLDWAEPARVFLGYGRPGLAPQGGSPAGTAPAAAAPAPATPPASSAGARPLQGAASAPGGPPPPASAPAGATAPPAADGRPPEPQILWVLAGRGECWFLEAASEQDWATYRFKGGDELPGLASRLMCAAQFSREALYMPLEGLVGERSEMAIAARDLPFLRALRERFEGRVLHTGMESWRKGLDAGA